MWSMLVCASTPSDAERLTRSTVGWEAGAVRVVMSVTETLRQLAIRTADVILVDANLAVSNWAGFIRQMVGCCPDAAVVLVGVSNPQFAAMAVSAGAHATFRTCGGGRDDLGSMLLRGIMTACARAGGTPGSAAPFSGGRPHPLTHREVEVLHCMSEGFNNAEIGRQLFITEDTVKTHCRRMYRKLGVRDRAHAVAYALRVGVVE